MLPGQKISPEDVFDLARRRVWILVVPAALAAAIGSVFIAQMPDRFRATATVMVVPQVVPERMVGKTVSQRLTERLDAMKQQVLSRTQLETLIKQHNLYPGANDRNMDEFVERMRTRDLGIRPIGDAFEVSYTGRAPRPVKLVADAIASKFIDQSVQDRQFLSDGTTRYFDAQLEDVRKKLEEQEAQFTAYRLKHAGELPAQQTANMADLNQTRQSIIRLHDQISQATDRRAEIEKNLTFLQTQAVVDPPPPPVARGGGRGVRTTYDELMEARDQVAEQERSGKSKDHPDVKVLLRRVDELEKRWAREVNERPVSDTAPVSAAEAFRQKQVTDAQDAIKAIDEDIAERRTKISQLEAREQELGAKVAAVPLREAEMIGLNRNYDQLKKQYEDLLGRRAQANLAANLDRQELGEQFRMVDPAVTPSRPFSPNRPALTMMAVTVGAGLGLVLLIFLEYRDRTFRTDDDLTRLLELPVLAVVPFMQTDDEKRRTFWRQMAVHAGCTATVAVCGAVVLMYLR
jgi:polysaccharide chain length determinant protein (PEP-CTERM system associated)